MLSDILDGIRQEFQLIHQVRKLGRVDLGELHLQKGELFVNTHQYLRRDAVGAALPGVLPPVVTQPLGLRLTGPGGGDWTLRPAEGDGLFKRQTGGRGQFGDAALELFGGNQDAGRATIDHRSCMIPRGTA